MKEAYDEAGLEPQTKRFYKETMTVLAEAGIPFLVGGAYALTHYTEIERHTKDLDLFIRPEDLDGCLMMLEEAGYETERTFPHWLAKAYRSSGESSSRSLKKPSGEEFSGGDFIDLIFSSRNGVARVDDCWFEHAPKGKALGTEVRLCPPEEMLWSKALIMERERYDGADVAHILHACADNLDWPRLLERFGPHWRVLLSHLLLFGFIYPSERDRVPAWVMAEFVGRLQEELACAAPKERLCHGTILSGTQYGVDIGRWGYEDVLQGIGDPLEEGS